MKSCMNAASCCLSWTSLSCGRLPSVVVRYNVVWCGVEWSGVPIGSSRDVLYTKKMQNRRAGCLNACCVWYVVHLLQRAVTFWWAWQRHSRAAVGMPY